MVILEEFLQQEIAKPFSYDLKTDCAGTVDRWIEANRGYSICERHGINYKSFDQKEGVLRTYINFLKAVYKVTRRNEEKQTKNPQKGDYAAIIVNKNQLGLAIHCGDFWFTRDTTGIIGAPIIGTKVLKAWKLNNG